MPSATAYGADGMSAEDHARWMAWERERGAGASAPEQAQALGDGGGRGLAHAASGGRAQQFWNMVMDPKTLWGKNAPASGADRIDWEVGDEVGLRNVRHAGEAVPTDFENADDYEARFMPLVAEEARQEVREAVRDALGKGANTGTVVGVLEFPELGEAPSGRVPRTLCLLVRLSRGANRGTKTFAKGTVALLTRRRAGERAGSSQEADAPLARVACVVRKVTEARTRVVDVAVDLGVLERASREHLLLEVVLHFYWAGHKTWSDAGLLTYLSQRVLRPQRPAARKGAAPTGKPSSALALEGVLLAATDEHLTGSIAEMEALGRVSKMQLYAALVSPDARDYPKYEEATPPPLCGALTHARNSRFESEFLQRRFNSSQQRAILWGAAYASATADGSSGEAGGRGARMQKNTSPPFTLIQGPPGTGKSHTVVGMLNVMHVSLMQRYYATRDNIFKKKRAALQEERGTVRAMRAAADLTKALIDSNERRPRLVVCAPSNTAVDELVRRVMLEGFVDGELHQYRPDILRVGSSSGVAASDDMVAQVELDTKVNGYLSMSQEELQAAIQGLGVHIDAEMRRASAIEGRLAELPDFDSLDPSRARAPAAATPSAPSKEILLAEPNEIDLEAQFSDEEDAKRTPASVGQTVVLGGADKTMQGGEPQSLPSPPPAQLVASELERIDVAKEERDLKIKLASCGSSIARDILNHNRFKIAQRRFVNRSSAQDEREARLQLEMSFVESAEIVFCTLGTAATKKVFQKLSRGFDITVVDEAAQACEPAVLPALQLGCKRAVLVGDPRQLPATIKSSACTVKRYDRSLFERLVLGGVHSTMLSVQYRMHPSIREFPSRRFYEGKLVDWQAPTGVSRPLFLSDGKSVFSPLTFFDVVNASESREGKSLSNPVEARLVVALWWASRCRVAETGGAGCGMGWGRKSSKPCPIKFGVITPYKEQTNLLERKFEAFCKHVDPIGDPQGRIWRNEVRIGTVDSFQGQEEDIVILSCVRGSKKGGIGFVDDPRRMNVAITRPRQALWICGSAATLARGSEDWSALVEHCKQRSCIVEAHGADPGGILFPEFAKASFPMGDSSGRGKKRSRDRGEEHRRPIAVPMLLPDMGTSGMPSNPVGTALLPLGAQMVPNPSAARSIDVPSRITADPKVSVVDLTQEEEEEGEVPEHPRTAPPEGDAGHETNLASIAHLDEDHAILDGNFQQQNGELIQIGMKHGKYHEVEEGEIEEGEVAEGALEELTPPLVGGSDSLEYDIDVELESDEEYVHPHWTGEMPNADGNQVDLTGGMDSSSSPASAEVPVTNLVDDGRNVAPVHSAAILEVPLPAKAVPVAEPSPRQLREQEVKLREYTSSLAKREAMDEKMRKAARVMAGRDELKRQRKEIKFILKDPPPPISLGMNRTGSDCAVTSSETRVQGKKVAAPRSATRPRGIDNVALQTTQQTSILDQQALFRQHELIQQRAISDQQVLAQQQFLTQQQILLQQQQQRTLFENQSIERQHGPSQNGLYMHSGSPFHAKYAPYEVAPTAYSPPPGLLQPPPGLLQLSQGLLPPRNGLLQSPPGLLQPPNGLLQQPQGLLLPPNAFHDPFLAAWVAQSGSYGHSELAHPQMSASTSMSTALLPDPWAFPNRYN